MVWKFLYFYVFKVLGKNSRMCVVIWVFLFHELENPLFSSPCQQKLCELKVPREPCWVERVKVERRCEAPNRTPQPFLVPNVINFSLRTLQHDFKLLLFFFYYLSAPQVAAKYTRLYLCMFIFWCRTYRTPGSLKYVLRPSCSGISFPEDYFIDVVYVSVCAFSLVFFSKVFFCFFFLNKQPLCISVPNLFPSKRSERQPSCLAIKEQHPELRLSVVPPLSFPLF